ncbi:MAG: fumarylacetoacetate hydrolase family protein [Gemmatimonadota bacterium]|nr:fumarylacetoacetate hydrolase family protein [Gemmatimonadota bacterium]
MNVQPSKIVCVGRNYAKHAAELGNEVPAEPLIFLKPPSAIIAAGEEIVIPEGVGRVDFEGEIGVVVGKRARKVSEAEAWEYVGAIIPANDVTARDLQRSDGQWSRAKGFDTFCPLGSPVPLSEVDVDAVGVTTRVNGEVRQEGSITDLVFSIPFLVAHISRIMTLEPGDLILTGTPDGVGPLSPGDVVEVEVTGVGKVRNPAVAETRR